MPRLVPTLGYSQGPVNPILEMFVCAQKSENK